MSRLYRAAHGGLSLLALGSSACLANRPATRLGRNPQSGRHFRRARLLWPTRQPFDTTFVRQLMVTHGQSLALHAAFAAQGTSATLQPVAANGESVEGLNLAMMSAR